MQLRTRELVLTSAALVSVALLVAVGLVKTRLPGQDLESYSRRPARIMGTESLLTAVVRKGQSALAQEALRAAETEIRHIETIASVYIVTSEISRLNAAAANEVVPLSSAALEMLTLARQMASQTGSAFDVTCRPMLQLWKEAAGQGRLPRPEERRRARETSRWEQFRLLPGGAVKSSASAEIDLGGIAKGFGIDRAVESLAASGCQGGMVNVGGDLRCFGTPQSGETFQVHLRNPFGKGDWATLSVVDRAVCTSGTYARYVTVDGKRYSHILDPLTGIPADFVPSVTVLASSAAAADAWATALSVLGPPGLALLPQDGTVDAILVVGTPDSHTIHATPGFVKHLPPDAAIRHDIGPLPR